MFSPISGEGVIDGVNHFWLQLRQCWGAWCRRAESKSKPEREHNPDGLLERLRVASEQSIRCNQLIIQEQMLLMDHLKAACARAPISRA